MQTKGRTGKLQKTITVTSNDPNNPTITLTIATTVEAEIAINPVSIMFKDMKKGEEKSEKVQIRNTSNVPLEILPIDTGEKSITIKLVNHPEKWPVELEPNQAIELLVTVKFDFDTSRYVKQVTIKYTGGEETDTYIRIMAFLEQTSQEKAPPKMPLPAEGKNPAEIPKQGLEIPPPPGNGGGKIFLPPPPTPTN